MAGDRVGPEITAEAVKVIDALSIDFEFLDCPVGGEIYLTSGEVLPRVCVSI
jgi:3-isopropylmalate dehydrogenase